MKKRLEIETSPHRVFIILLSIISLLLCAHSVGLVFKFVFNHDYVYGLVPLIDFNTERNIPTAFAGLQLLFASSILAFISASRKTNGESYAYWFALTLLFAFISFDELFQIHEKLARPIREEFSLTGVLFYAWVIPYGLAMITVVILFSRFLYSLPRKTAKRFVAAGLMFLSGALGLEMLGALLESKGDFGTLAYSLLYTFEELLEFVGIAFFIYSLLLYVSDQKYSLQIMIRD